MFDSSDGPRTGRSRVDAWLRHGQGAVPQAQRRTRPTRPITGSCVRVRVLLGGLRLAGRQRPPAARAEDPPWCLTPSWPGPLPGSIGRRAPCHGAGRDRQCRHAERELPARCPSATARPSPQVWGSQTHGTVPGAHRGRDPDVAAGRKVRATPPLETADVPPRGPGGGLGAVAPVAERLAVARHRGSAARVRVDVVGLGGCSAAPTPEPKKPALASARGTVDDKSSRAALEPPPGVSRGDHARAAAEHREPEHDHTDSRDDQPGSHRAHGGQHAVEELLDVESGRDRGLAHHRKVGNHRLRCQQNARCRRTSVEPRERLRRARGALAAERSSGLGRCGRRCAASRGRILEDRLPGTHRSLAPEQAGSRP